MRRLPGDPHPGREIEGMIRVNHAGEYGAMRIYAGQLAVMPQGPARRLVEHMATQEKHHLETFDVLLKTRKIRPTLLMPLWHAAGFALGAATALMGEKAAFACTVAVESVIDGHYADQQQRLDESEGELAQTIATFRAEEMEHHDTGLAQGAEEAPFYTLLSLAVGKASKAAIWLSTRI